MDQSNDNAFTPSVSWHNYRGLNLFYLWFLSEANLSIVFFIPTSLCNNYQTGSDDPLFFVLCFWRIQKVESLILKTDVVSKILNAIFSNFLLLLTLLIFKLLAKLSIYKEKPLFFNFSRISKSNESLLILFK